MNTWPDILTALINREDLDTETTQWAMREILSGNVAPVRMAAFMSLLRAKGETVNELDALAGGMLEVTTTPDIDRDTVDVVGSGGDRANTVNISTMAAIVAAAAGAKVVKHGNRAASSMSGTADCLEAVGVALEVPPHKQQQVLDECGIVFLFAPMYHASLRYTAPTRRELGVQTTFNFLGPLSNPARPNAGAIGIANYDIARLVAGVLAKRDNRGLVFHGTDGLDELTTTSASDVWLISNRQIRQMTLDPKDLGITPAAPEALTGGPPSHNAQVLRDVMAGETGPVRDIVLLNAAATLLAYDGPELLESLTDQLGERMDRAARAIDDGSAARLVDAWVASTNAAMN